MKTEKYIDKLLSKEISFYSKLKKKEKDEIWEFLDDYEKHRINEKVQKKFGIGKDKFRITEIGFDDKIEKFNTVKDYDYDSWKFQESFLEDENKEKKYLIYLRGDWIRYIKNKKLIYGDMISLYSYIYDILTSYMFKLENRLFPHTIEMKTGKKTKNGRTVDIKTFAYGRKKEYEEWKKNWYYEYSNKLYKKIKKNITKKYTNITIHIKTSKKFKQNKNWDSYERFIFSDKTAMENVRFKNFIEDFNKIKKDKNIISKEIKKWKKKVKKDFFYSLSK